MSLIIKTPGALSQPGLAPMLPDLISNLAWDFDANDLLLGAISSNWESKGGSFNAYMTPYSSTGYAAPVVADTGPGGTKAVVFAQTETSGTGLTLSMPQGSAGIRPLSYAYMLRADPNVGSEARVHSAGQGQHSLRVTSGIWTAGVNTRMAIGPIADKWQALTFVADGDNSKSKLDNAPIVNAKIATVASDAASFYVGTSLANTASLPALGHRFKGRLVRWKAWDRVLTADELDAAISDMQHNYPV